jgi:hypothetical protein
LSSTRVTLLSKELEELDKLKHNLWTKRWLSSANTMIIEEVIDIT